MCKSKLSRLRFIMIAAIVLCAFPGISSAGEPVGYRLDRQDGRVVIRSTDGKIIPWISYGLSRDHTLEKWKEKQKALLDAGVHLFLLEMIQTKDYPGRKASFWSNPFWPNEGGTADFPEDVIAYAEQAKFLLAADPDARFLIRCWNIPPDEWRVAHLAEFIPGSSDPKTPPIMHSLASQTYLKGMAQMIHGLVNWCESQPWRDRIVGYTVFPMGEGASLLGDDRLLFDPTPPMQNAFKEYAAKQYKTDAVLQEAWHDPSATLDSVHIPTEAEWMQKRKAQKLLHWPDPALTRRERDYFELHNQLFHRYVETLFGALADATKARPVLKGSDMLKQPSQGWLLYPQFFGSTDAAEYMEHWNVHLASGSIGIAPLLELPGLDMIQTPGIYYNRGMGYSWQPEGIADSLTLRGKVNFMEADIRTWSRLGEKQADAGTLRTPVEAEAGFLRTHAWALAQNQMYYYYSMGGQFWWYQAPEVAKIIGNIANAGKAMPAWPWRETEHAICVVIDDESAMDEDFTSGYQFLAVFRQLQEDMAHCGVPFRIHLLADLQRADFPNYRCWLFPNLFKLDSKRLAMLRKSALRNGNIAIFGPATGITDGQKLSADGATALFGTPMELVSKQCQRRVLVEDNGHPLSQRLPTMAFGDSYAYGPTLVPAAQRLPMSESNAVSLGSSFLYYTIDRPGMFIREFGLGAAGNGKPGVRGADDYAVIFTAAVPLPAPVLRELSRYGGCNIWSEENAVINACDTFASIHAVKSGNYKIHLPRECNVRDALTGAPILAKATEIPIAIAAPETKLFLLE